MRFRIGLIALLLTCTSVLRADLTLNFSNENTDYSASDVYIMFGGTTDAANLVGTINGGGSLALGTNYSLNDVSSGINLSKFVGGRIYVSLGSQLTSPTAGNAYSPNFNNTSGADYGTRWDKIEITYDSSNGGLNLSSADFFSVPLRATTTGGTAPTTLTWNTSTSTAFHALGALSSFNTTADGLNGPPVVTGSGGVSVNTGSGSIDVIRVISPSSISSTQASKYPSFDSYLSDLQTNGTQTKIEGTYFATNETYDLTGTIANSTHTSNGVTVNAGDLELTGTIDGNNTTLVVRASELTSFDIYGVNPEWEDSRNPGTPGTIADNNAAAGAVADMISGLNFGLVGSSEDNPNMTGTTIGDSPSYTWYGNNINGLLDPKLDISAAFAAAQPGNADDPYFFNSYAGYLQTVTDSYGFPFTDRLEAPLASLDGTTQLDIAVLSDIQGSNGGGSPVIPEPSTWFLTLLGLAALLPRVLPRRRKHSA